MNQQIDLGEDTPSPHKRRWWVALLLSVFTASGYLYVGRPARFAVFFITPFALALAVKDGLGGWLAEPVIYILFTLALIGLLVFFLADVIRLAVRQKHYELRPYNRWWVYGLSLVAFLGLALLSKLPGLTPGIDGAVQAYSFFGGGVLRPTIRSFERVVADLKAYESAAPQRGDVVAMSLPGLPHATLIRRIVGLPGENVKIADGVLYINDRPAPEKFLRNFDEPTDPDRERKPVIVRRILPEGRSYLSVTRHPDNPWDNYGPVKVPKGHYLVLGDNRCVSPARRREGIFPAQDVKGQVKGIIFSLDWRRIGKRIE